MSTRYLPPLKQILLLADFYMLAKIAADFSNKSTAGSSAEPEHSSMDFMLAFAAYMRSKTKRVHIRDDNGQIEVILGNNSIVLEAEHVTIRDDNDYPYQKDVRTVGEDEAALFSSREFLEKEQEAWENCSFSTEIAYDLKGNGRF